MSTQVILRLPEDQQTYTLECQEGESLLEALLRQKVTYRAECGGRGTCGKCKVKVLTGEVKITSWDRLLFSEEELQQGYRLSCKAYPEGDCYIELLPGYETRGYDIVTEMSVKGLKVDNQSAGGQENPTTDPIQSQYPDAAAISAHTGSALSIAIDLGTTTLAFALVDPSGRVIRTYTALNPQRAYGADVISRMKASTEGKQELLRDGIRAELEQGIRELINSEGINQDLITQIILAGNTTMIHLLMGYDCSTLGTYPFTPVNISTIRLEASELFSEEYHMPITILPGISVFVGGDILAGLLACSFDRSEKISLLVDLGTNEEMALGNRNSILVTSTAAGPAFEGGNLTCGVGSIPGAISHVVIEEGLCRYETIGGKPPLGICGTGVIELASELIRTGRMDETGLLADPYFEQGFEIGGMRFLQKDIRELQMAKAAVRAGIEILIRRYGITTEAIDKVYLAGGFGYKLDVTKAIRIGLFPPELTGRIEAVGNSALSGAIRYLTDIDAETGMEQLLSVSQDIHLSNEPDFFEIYIGAMSFQK